MTCHLPEGWELQIISHGQGLTQRPLSFLSLDCHSCATFSVMNLPHSQEPGSAPCWLWAPTSLHQREPLEPCASKGFYQARQKMKPRGNTGACGSCLRFLTMKLCLSMNLREKKLTQKTNSLDNTKLITVQSPFPMVCGVGPEEGAPETGNQETADWLCDLEQVANYSPGLIKFYCNTCIHTYGFIVQWWS